MRGASAAGIRGTILQATELRSTRIEGLRALAALAVVVCHTYIGPTT